MLPMCVFCRNPAIHEFKQGEYCLDMCDICPKVEYQNGIFYDCIKKEGIRKAYEIWIESKNPFKEGKKK
jgi:hypothetical protein